METVTDNMLDVTLLEPRMKHPTIFAGFDALAEGQSLVIHNDHDPKPLYYQLLGERGNVFNWEYLTEGPRWWKVRITKRRADEQDETLGQIAAKDLRKAEVFKKYGLDFCCGGKKTVKQACAEKGLDVTRIEQELQQADKLPTAQALPYQEWSLAFLSDYIINTHHLYVKKSLPELEAYAIKVAAVHGGNHPELAEIKALVQDLKAEMTTHMAKEEKIVFPYIKNLEGVASRGVAVFDSITQPVHQMEIEHESAGLLLEKIRQLSHDYQAPQDACGSYRMLYSMLEAFENDLHLHVHLENNILFPKSIELEKKSKSIQVQSA
ncbi:MAG TPA: iron-sulfur cluster repair di-iron protein [Saprospiraceae bacterium]|nr:iron-sulfur cluster repair di-iron protein [Saprospiraceae bacterium]HNT20410.1 iron-sulfur cluster repair di-iron protein [Saprospiraceae bacterium]